jgi:hypothetical protein
MYPVHTLQARFELLCLEQDSELPLAEMKKAMYEIETVLAAKFDVAKYQEMWAEDAAEHTESPSPAETAP